MKLNIKKRTLPKVVNRMKKKIRVRKSVTGTPERPRLTIYRSLGNMYAQLIDDTTGTTLATASTLEKTLGGKGKAGRVGAAAVGKEIAKRGQDKKISRVVFDRNGYLYHGRVKALADAAREAGLKF